MDNNEEVLQALHDFETMTDADKVLTQELEQLLGFIAQTGRILYPWSTLKPVFMFKMDRVMRDFFESSPSRNSTSSEPTHVAEFEVMRQRLLDCLDAFTSPPFTAQRLCELMVEPKRHYKNSEKFMRGIEKNVLVVSTMLEGEGDEHAVNNIDSVHTVPSIPNGPVTNGIMTTALPTEMEAINASTANERAVNAPATNEILPAHIHNTPNPSHLDTQNHNGNAQTNGGDHGEENKELGNEKEEERTEEQTIASNDEGAGAQEGSKPDQTEQQPTSISQQDNSGDTNSESTPQLEAQGSSDNKPEETKTTTDDSHTSDESLDERKPGSPDGQVSQEEPMDEN